MQYIVQSALPAAVDGHLALQAIKTIEKKGLQTMAKEVGLDLMSLPYIDCSSNRQEWLAKQPKVPAQVSSPSVLLLLRHRHVMFESVA